MGLVDFAKRSKGKIEDQLLPQRFVYHHIPKCGGTSVGRALRKRYLLSQATVTPESSFRAFEIFTARNDREKMLIDVLDLREQMLLYHLFEDVRGVSLHVRFSEIAYQRFKDNYKFVTMLRDPVKRFVSHYHWSYGKPQAHARIEDDFETFLESPRAKRIGATYVEYLCGLPKDVPTDSDEAVSAAISNLGKFSVVGDISDTRSFEQDIRKELGVRVKIKHENKGSKASRSRSELENPEWRAKIESLCAPDIAVWKAANAVQGGRDAQ
ncbi:sulfotransferase family 2 domain-containing protein [Actibacterium atlanticum]|uniref:sulfotransferase family 2 domain-containing protein n=1 Tax=Actibacterium atlanticum TaxID=1461693 RepID=UPI00138DEA7B|nr:sulfotransferase family 2 domain-containing protein [Actibacterium atlanticum]